MKLRLKSIYSVVLLGMALVAFCLAGPIAHAATAAPTDQIKNIQTLEEALYTVRYDQEGADSRVARLEQTVFGQPQLGLSMDARIKKLQEVMSASLEPLKPTATPVASTSPTTQTFPTNSGQAFPTNAGQAKPATKYTTPANQANSQPATYQTAKPDESDYPTVTQMERKVFGRAYVGEDVNQRLGRLEKSVFKNVQSGALADRMDNLRFVLLGDTGPGNVANADDGTTYRYNTTTSQPQNAATYPATYGGKPQPGGFRQVLPGAQAAYKNGPMDSGINGYQTASRDINSPYSTLPGGQYYNPGQGGGTYSGNDPYANDPYASENEQPVSYNAPMGQNRNVNANVNSPVTPDMMSAMDEVEKEVLGTTHPSDPMNARLDRVETKIFHTTSPEMSDDERLQRVIAVAAADGGNPTKSKAKTTIQTLLPIILTILPMILL